MPAQAEKVSQSALDGNRLRVVLMLEVEDGAEQRFLDAYDQMCRHVAAVPGHVSDQLCQSIENPSQWLITSEWESALHFLAWVDSPTHLEMVQPMHGCVKDTRSLRFGVLRETRTSYESGRMQTVPRVGDGIIRHAITFTVKPGSEQKVADILSGYTSPQAVVDENTRLCRTSLFMHGNRVVRAVEVEETWPGHCVTSPASPRCGRSRKPSTPTWRWTGTSTTRARHGSSSPAPRSRPCTTSPGAPTGRNP